MKYGFLLIIIILSISLYSQEEKLEVEGAIQIDVNDDPTPDAGTIRWTGHDFEGYTGTEWVSLTIGPISYTTVSDIDGNSYKTHIIGTQEWFIENLRTTTLNDGTGIPYVPNRIPWSQLSTMGYCYPKNIPVNDIDYGKLYNQYTVDTGKLCPTGWHVPSDSEFDILINFLGGSLVAGGKMKEPGAQFFSMPNIATNSSKFSARAAGHRDSLGWFSTSFMNVAHFWTSTNTNGKYLLGSTPLILNLSASKKYGYSVRCLKD
jgi:uncharacterized protein (TIGR02145 family)